MPYPWSLSEPPSELTPNPYLEPETFVAGDTFEFRKRSDLYPSSDGWSLTYCLRGGGGTKIDINSTTDQGDYVLTVAATSTAGWAVGQYSMAGFAIKGSERHQIYAGFITVTKDIKALDASQDLRSHARKVLDNIESVLEGRATNDILDSQIDNTSFRRLTPEQLLVMHSYYSAKVRAEEAKARVKNGLASGRNIFVRFTRPS